MARRKDPIEGRAWTPDKVRQRIRVSMLVNRLQNHAFGKEEITDSQRKAIEILLKKTLPDLANVEMTHTGPGGGPVMISSTDAEL